jgi:hypothetical protein
MPRMLGLFFHARGTRVQLHGEKEKERKKKKELYQSFGIGLPILFYWTTQCSPHNALGSRVRDWWPSCLACSAALQRLELYPFFNFQVDMHMATTDQHTMLWALQFDFDGMPGNVNDGAENSKKHDIGSLMRRTSCNGNTINAQPVSVHKPGV